VSTENTAETGIVAVNGAQLFYRMAGEGEPLVLLHAGVADSRMWDGQFETFTQHYRVIAYDLRGYGQSDMPDHSFAHHRDLTALLDHLNVESTHLLGASDGGAVALNFALEHPSRVRTISLADAAVEGYQFTDHRTQEGWEETDTALENGDFERAAEIEAEMWLAGPSRTLDQLDPELRTLLRDMLLQSYEVAPNGEGNEQELQPPAVSRLDEIEAPTLILVGDQDRPDILAIAEILAEQLSGAEKTVIPETAHLPNLERPDLFTEHVLDFVNVN
jgi:3-oxoadipate enol-lactonase